MNREAAKSYDVVVIGAGNGGLAAAIRVLQGGFSKRNGFRTVAGKDVLSTAGIRPQFFQNG